MEKRGNKRIIWALFALYCVAMAWLLFGQRLGQGQPDYYWGELSARMNLTPGRTIRHFLALILQSGSGPLIRSAAVNLAGNVGVFVPMGLFLPLLWPPARRYWLAALIMAAVVTAVELVQLATHLGVCDVDDLILNLAGGSIGYGLYALFSRWRGGRAGKEQTKT